MREIELEKQNQKAFLANKKIKQVEPASSRLFYILQI